MIQAEKKKYYEEMEILETLGKRISSLVSEVFYLEPKDNGPNKTKSKTLATINNVMGSHIF